jgi:hypothetical protein
VNGRNNAKNDIEKDVDTYSRPSSCIRDSTA